MFVARLFLTLVVAVPPAADPAGASVDIERQRSKAVTKMALETAQVCKVVPDDGSGKRLKLHPSPILRWSNPTVGSVYGEVFVWTSGGRPEVVASFYHGFVPAWGSTLELHSLSDSGLTVANRKKTFWSPREAGVTFDLLPDAPPPAATPAGRLRQTRALVRRFAAVLVDYRTGDPKGVDRRLRSLEQPVFRYESQTGQPYDGALFAFVEGTDPEVWLMIETRISDGKSAWNFALARMNRDEIRVTYQDKEVWRVPNTNKPWGNLLSPYALFMIRKGWH